MALPCEVDNIYLVIFQSLSNNVEDSSYLNSHCTTKTTFHLLSENLFIFAVLSDNENMNCKSRLLREMLLFSLMCGSLCICDS